MTRRCCPPLAGIVVAALVLLHCGDGQRDGDPPATPEPATAASATSGAHPATGSPPSFLLLTLDTTRADRLEPYGARGAATPALAALATGGVVFERAYATTPVTLPSHASVFTGLYPPAHGVRNNAIHALGDEHATLAEILRDAGFRTAAFVSVAVLARRYGLDQGFEVYDDDLAGGKPREMRMNAERPAGATVSAALGWLDALGAGERFFLWVHLFDPHADYAPPPPYDERFRDRPYDGEIAYVDAEIGRLLGHPRLGGDTLVMAIADHGESLGEHGESTHAMLAYDATLRVPWLVRLPGGDGGGRRLEAPVSQVDLLPTALELLGVPPAAGVEVAGTSHAAAIRGDAVPAPERALYAETLVPFYTYGWAPLRTVRRGGLKLIEAPVPELYDLENDPNELRNLAALRPDETAELRRLLVELAGEDAAPAATVEVDAETRARLESLGYLSAAGAGAERATRPDPKDVIALHDRVERASDLLHRGQYDEAAGELRRVLARDPENPLAIVELAKTLAARGRLDQALELGRRALALDPEDPELYVAMGLLEGRRGRLDAALAAFDAALALDPRSLDARIEKARLLARQDRGAEAAALVTKLLAEGSGEARVDVAYAELVELPAGEHDAAARRLRAAVNREPYLPEGWRVLGRALHAGGRWQEAALVYRQGVERVPWDGRLHAQLGLLLGSRGRDVEAEAPLRRALELLPVEETAPVHGALAAIHVRRRQWTEAEAEARRAVELDPGLAGGWNYLGAALEEQGRYDAALAAYERALAIPGYWPAALNQALLLRRLERYEPAAAALQKVLGGVPDHAGAHYELGLLYAGPLADPARARRHLETALRVEPGHPRAAQIRALLAEPR